MATRAVQSNRQASGSRKHNGHKGIGQGWPHACAPWFAIAVWLARDVPASCPRAAKGIVFVFGVAAPCLCCRMPPNEAATAAAAAAATPPPQLPHRCCRHRGCHSPQSPLFSCPSACQRIEVEHEKSNAVRECQTSTRHLRRFWRDKWGCRREGGRSTRTMAAGCRRWRVRGLTRSS